MGKSKFSKEELVAEATTIFDNEKDAQAIVNEFIPENDNFGNIENLLKRFKCYLELQEIRAYLENPTDSKLEKIHEAKEAMYKQLLELTKRTEKMQDQKEIFDETDATLAKLLKKEKMIDKE
jgi:hypothetical protein